MSDGGAVERVVHHLTAAVRRRHRPSMAPHATRYNVDNMRTQRSVLPSTLCAAHHALTALLLSSGA